MADSFPPEVWQRVASLVGGTGEARVQLYRECVVLHSPARNAFRFSRLGFREFRKSFHLYLGLERLARLSRAALLGVRRHLGLEDADAAA